MSLLFGVVGLLLLFSLAHAQECVLDEATCSDFDKLELIGFLGNGRIKTTFLTTFRGQYYALRLAFNRGLSLF
jgi:hypothetical protein